MKWTTFQTQLLQKWDQSVKLLEAKITLISETLQEIAHITSQALDGAQTLVVNAMDSQMENTVIRDAI